MFLVLTILFLVDLPVSMTAVRRPEGRILIDVPLIDVNCKPPKVCSTLYFYDADWEPLGEVHGTNKTLRVRNVVRVQRIGTGGSFTVFKRKNHRSNSGIFNCAYSLHQGRKCMY